MSVVGSTGDLGFGDYQSTTLTPGFQRLSTTTNAGGGMGPLDLGGKSDKAYAVITVAVLWTDHSSQQAGNSVSELCITLRRLARDALDKVGTGMLNFLHNTRTINMPLPYVF